MRSKVCFGNFYGKLYGILVWEIVIRTENQLSLKMLQEKLLFLPWKLQNYISSEFVGDNASKGYDCFCNLFFDWEEALTSLEFENV